MPLDLEECAPEDVAVYSTLPELLEAVEAISRWSDRKAAVLDYVYCERLLKLIRTNAPREQLEEFNEHLVQVVHPLRQEDLDGLSLRYYQRWSLLRELLERRIESLRGELPQQLLAREHVSSILEYLSRARGPVSQQDLMRELDLRKANLSRILSRLEAHELIEKLPGKGGSNLISLGFRGRELELASATAPQPPTPTVEKPGTMARFSSLMADDDSPSPPM
ncbi:MAG TPA: MarR family transcriptional regulator [Archangium sp.]|uniref:helix-turn-helix transcriptional regulator n=1 Tax=Archangium sp. TaxID=1872627 RepID=UPI002E36559B|nr:MarR family transcriptional regulator [Archangium sp.]HEX5748300.1 MarR family transcriptional regulator [Archangium sp.]